MRKSRVFRQDPTATLIPSFIATVKCNTGWNGQLTAVIILHVCLSTEVPFGHAGVGEICRLWRQQPSADGTRAVRLSPSGVLGHRILLAEHQPCSPRLSSVWRANHKLFSLPASCLLLTGSMAESRASGPNFI